MGNGGLSNGPRLEDKGGEDKLGAADRKALGDKGGDRTGGTGVSADLRILGEGVGGYV